MKDEIIPSGMRILPRDEECEKRVLGTILSERDTIYEVRDILTENCFYNDFHKQIYRTVLEITDSGGRADAVSVKSKLEFSYPDFSLYELVKISGMYTFDLYQYACRLHDLMIRRRFLILGVILTVTLLMRRKILPMSCKKCQTSLLICSHPIVILSAQSRKA